MAMEPALTQQLLQRSFEMSMSGRSARITLRHAITGESICLPGVATFENGWTVPGDYGVDSLLAHGGVLVFKVREDGTVDSWIRARNSSVFLPCSSRNLLARRRATIGSSSAPLLIM